MIRLHDSLVSGNGYEARLLLRQLGIPFELIEYDLGAGETRTPEFLKKANPNGRILFYLAEGTTYFPEGRFERAQTLQWMFFEQYSQTSQNSWA
jgi:glutathione S-transferase